MTQVTAFKASDGTLHETEDALTLHEAGLKFNATIYKFIGAQSFKGRTKSLVADILRSFLVWNASGQPAPAATPEPAPAE